MNSGNQSFFERLTGTVNLNDDTQDNQPMQRQQPPQGQSAHQNQHRQQSGGQNTHNNQDEFSQQDEDKAAGYAQHDDQWSASEQPEAEAAGELAVDVYQTPNQVIIQTMVAGVRPEELDVSISREQCTISGRRQRPRDIPPEDYHHQELYWGAFSRSVSLPVEVDVEEAEANESHGLLTITLPKVDRHQETTLEINSA